MNQRPWLGALGLRGRIMGAVLVTAVAALAVAAVVLLGPLEASLRNADLKTLTTEVQSLPGSFRGTRPWLVAEAQIPASSPATKALRKQGWGAYTQLEAAAKALGGRIDASEVALLGYPDAYGHPSPRPLVEYGPDKDLITGDQFDDAVTAFRTNTPITTSGSISGVEFARRAIPFNAGHQRWVLVIRKRLDEVSSAAAAVRTAFLVAALAALGLTLILGIPLSDRIVRRLRRLRQAALRLAHEGPSKEVYVPVDRARDEVGDLARTFALMQRQLLQQEEARRAFVATASHELRTPLATLDGMLELLGEDLRGGTPDLDEAQELLERARVQSRRLGRLAADLLDLSRLDAQVELRSEPVELSELSRAVLAEFELGTAERAISTALDDHIGPVWALGDPGSVARILRILVDNAVRISPDGGEVRVELRNGRAASLSVCDEGPGVPPEERELIFERFKRGTGTAGQAGFGLGLAIGRELAERMGGELVLEDRDSAGAKFTLRLPVAEAPDIEPIAVA